MRLCFFIWMCVYDKYKHIYTYIHAHTNTHTHSQTCCEGIGMHTPVFLCLWRPEVYIKCLPRALFAGSLSLDVVQDLGWMCEVSAEKRLWLPVVQTSSLGCCYLYSFKGWHEWFCNQFCFCKFLKMVSIITSLFLVFFFTPLSPNFPTGSNYIFDLYLNC